MLKCSNCGIELTEEGYPVFIYHRNNRVAVICDECQKARKISIVLAKVNDAWFFEQYRPVEV